MVEKIVFIYGLIEPLTNELRYIGKSINPKVRLRKHISERFIHDSYKDRWLRKLIDLNIRPELFIIDEVLEDEWVFWEQHYIGYYKMIGVRLTNTTIGGDQPPSTKGRKHNEESKRKMSEYKKGKPIPWLNTGNGRSEKHQNNLSKALKGRLSPNKGKKFSKDMCDKLSDSSTVKKKVVQIDLNGEIVKIWDSISKAEKVLRIRHISECCRGIRYKTTGGYMWEYYKK